METYIQITKEHLKDSNNSMILINNNKSGMEIYEVLYDGELTVQCCYLRKKDLEKAISTIDVLSLMDIAKYAFYNEADYKDVIETLLKTFEVCMTANSTQGEIIEDFEKFILDVSKLEKSIHSVTVVREL